jgi:cytochrome c biogenesis protein CcmG/thiol:disulfide interchange protein DsbE
VRRALAIGPLIVMAALVLVFGLYAINHNPEVIPRATVGQPAPKDALPLLDGGRPVTVRALVKGRTLVNFFGSYCVPCVEEAPTLAALRAEGVQVIGIAWKDDPAKTREFLQRYGDPYRAVLVDSSGRAGIDFGLTGVPETYLLGADGRILDKRAGAMSPADAEALLGRAGP